MSTRVGGIPELVKHMVNGLLVEPDPICISNAVVRILSDIDLRDRQKEGARTFSEFVRTPKDSDFERILKMKIQELMSP